MAKQLTPQTVDTLINQALAIEDDAAKEAGALGFMARALVQATLPHKKVEGNEFVRRNGSYSLTILAPSKIGLPYGSVPRLLLAWMTTEAVKTQNRELVLGDSLNSFMRELGLQRQGGKRGDITRLKEQMRRLFASTVSMDYEGDGVKADTGFRLTDKSILWWDDKNPGQSGLWESTVTLSDAFFREIVERPVPVDLRALQALKRSPMALDIYTWLTYRVSYLKRPVVIPWDGLMLQFGSDYKLKKHFRQAFLGELRKVLLVYGDAKLEEVQDGLMVKPAPPHIKKADK